MAGRSGRVDTLGATKGAPLVADDQGHFRPSDVQDLSSAIRLNGTGGHVGFAPKNLATLAIAAGAGAGTSPPAPTLLSASSDTAGEVNMGTGTSPAAGDQATVTFATAFTAEPIVVISPQNAATAALRPYVSARTTTGFTIGFGVAGSASQPTGTYVIDYVVIGRPN